MWERILGCGENTGPLLLSRARVTDASEQNRRHIHKIYCNIKSQVDNPFAVRKRAELRSLGSLTPNFFLRTPRLRRGYRYRQHACFTRFGTSEVERMLSLAGT